MPEAAAATNSSQKQQHQEDDTLLLSALHRHFNKPGDSTRSSVTAVQHQPYSQRLFACEAASGRCIEDEALNKLTEGDGGLRCGCVGCVLEMLGLVC